MPADGAFDGVHTLRYFATDAAGNIEPAHTCQLRIDTTAPAVAVRAAAGWQGRRVRLQLSRARRAQPDGVRAS